MSNGTRSAWGRVAALAKGPPLWLSVILPIDVARVQGERTVQDTGLGQPLISEVRSVSAGGDGLLRKLLFTFGFATEEAVVPGSFLDSYTVTLQTTDQRAAVVYLTTDAHGLVLAPASPGAVVIDPASITLVATTYPDLLPEFPHRLAYQVDAAIPAELQGGSLSVFFDLFDNQDAKASQAWFSDLQVVVVPEPETTGLTLGFLALGLGVGLRVRACRENRRGQELLQANGIGTIPRLPSGRVPAGR